MNPSPVSIYDPVTYKNDFLFKEELQHIFHSSFSIKNFPFAQRLDLFAVVEPGEKALFFDVGKEELCGTETLDRLVEMYHIPWSSVEIVLSHFHDDHDGCVQHCINKGVTHVYHGPRLCFSQERKQVFLQRTGILKKGDKELEPFVDFFLQRNRFSPEVEAVLREVPEGKVFSIAGYAFKVVYTPGHTPEHISLYEPDKNILFAGDFVLDAAPGVMQFIPDSHMLEKYLHELGKAREANLSALYMSHHEVLFNIEEANVLISKQIDSYDHPLRKVLAQFIPGEWLDAYDVALRYCSDRAGDFKKRDCSFRIRKIANMYAYLDFLVSRGLLEKRLSSDGRDVFLSIRV